MNNLKNSSRYNCKTLCRLFCAIWFFNQKAEVFVFVFFMSMDVVLLYWYFTLYQKVRNYKILLCSIFSKITLTLAFSSTPKESRFTCTVVRPLGIVARGIRAARVWPSDTLIDVYRYIANKQLTKIYKWLEGQQHYLIFIFDLYSFNVCCWEHQTGFCSHRTVCTTTKDEWN